MLERLHEDIAKDPNLEPYILWRLKEDSTKTQGLPGLPVRPPIVSRTYHMIDFSDFSSGEIPSRWGLSGLRWATTILRISRQSLSLHRSLGWRRTLPDWRVWIGTTRKWCDPMGTKRWEVLNSNTSIYFAMLDQPSKRWWNWMCIHHRRWIPVRCQKLKISTIK